MKNYIILNIKSNNNLIIQVVLFDMNFYSRNNMNKIATFLLTLITTSQLLAVNNLPATSDPVMKEKADKQIKLQNHKVLQSAVDAYKKNLPQKVDKYTTFTDVKSQGLTLIRVYEINTGAKSDETVRNEDKSRMQKAIQYGVCTTSKRFLDSNINLTYLYKSAKSKADLFKFEFSAKDCANIWAGLE